MGVAKDLAIGQPQITRSLEQDKLQVYVSSMQADYSAVQAFCARSSASSTTNRLIVSK